MNVLVLGASGMLGNTVFRLLSEDSQMRVFGSVRSAQTASFFDSELHEGLVQIEDLTDPNDLQEILERVQPDVVVNCTSARQVSNDDVFRVFAIYAALPQRLSHLCMKLGIRLIHFSSDGVFSGARGAYDETDIPDATDLYGTAKLLGEVDGASQLSIRTSMIGHELHNKSGLLEWFLSQGDACRCYTRAIFTGLPTTELAALVRDVILPRPELSGIYHVASTPISKFDLLSMVAREYSKTIDISPDDSVAIDRSLSAERFRLATGYVAPEWSQLLRQMRTYKSGLVRH